MEPERCVFFEGEVRQHKRVPAELRTLERGGFGVCLLSPRDAQVVLSLVLEFSGQVVELEAQVVQVFPPQEGSGAVVGLALLFTDRTRAESLLRPWLGHT
ncbi:hypothetical protein [Archangium violaceum]|uniref:PilZ domain-containing protein n=1 Tax=Archangium violaceum Cb vi76 TaxID=1406225 RepID=A0A084T187_9BACT|nr:hypothetical protein [Archangium violaceum]KFA94472.1 hypothetical protein Q664_02870 [Archangium violaceum Cb vi76]